MKFHEIGFSIIAVWVLGFTVSALAEPDANVVQSLSMRDGYLATPATMCEIEASKIGANRCTIDTGSNASVLPSALLPWAKTQKPLQKFEMRGIGSTSECFNFYVDWIDVDASYTGSPMPARLTPPAFLACERFQEDGIIGIDALDFKIWHFDFSHYFLSELKQAPGGTVNFKLLRDELRKAYIPLLVGNASIRALFDTGAARTSVTSNFVLAHPELVHLNGQTSKSSDINGVTFEKKMATVKSLTIAGTIFSNVEVDVIDADPNFIMLAPMTLGMNLIGQFNWIIDLKNNTWGIALLPPVK